MLKPPSDILLETIIQESLDKGILEEWKMEFMEDAWWYWLKFASEDWEYYSLYAAHNACFQRLNPHPMYVGKRNAARYSSHASID